MALSNRKIKAIRRLSRSRTAEEIGRELNISLEEVLRYVRASTLTDRNGKRKKAAGRIPAAESRFAFWLLLAILVTLPFLINPKGFNYADLIKRAFLQCGVLILLLVWVLESLRSKPPAVRIKQGVPWVPVAVFLTGCFISLFWAGDVYLGLTQIIHWVTAALYLIVAYHLIMNRKRMNFLLAALALAGAAAAFIGVLQYLVKFDGIRQSAPPAVTFANKNFAVQFVILCLPASLGLLLMNRQRWLLLPASVAWVLMTTYVFYTFTKAAWAAYLGQLVFLVLFLFWVMVVEKKGNALSRDQWIATGLSIAMILVLVNLKPVGNRQSALQSVEKRIAEKVGSSATARVRIWLNTFEIIERFPVFGIGARNFSVYYPMGQITSPTRDKGLRLGRTPRVAHNDFLQLQAEMGLFFTVSLMAFAFLVFRRIPILWRQQLSPTDRLVLVIALMGVIGYGLEALFSSPTYHATTPVLGALYVALFFRFSHRLQQTGSNSGPVTAEPGDALRLSRQWAWAGAFILTVLAVFWIGTQVNWVKADTLRNVFMYSATKSKQWETATRLWPAIVRLNAMRLDQYKFLGISYRNRKLYDEAIRAFLEHHKRYPHDPLNLYNIVLCYMRVGQHEKALPYSEHLLAILPEDKNVISQHRWLKARLKGKARLPAEPEIPPSLETNGSDEDH
jgi:O-antigen ligase